jgi:hypothetical protein
MYVERNTPPLPFQSDDAIPADRAEVDSAIEALRMLAAISPRESVSMIAQMVGSLVLIGFFAYAMRRGAALLVLTACLFVVGCYQGSEGEPFDSGKQLDAADPDCGTLQDNLLGDDLRSLAGPECYGLWLSSPGGDTRVEADPRTGRCTFPCEVGGGEPLCRATHADHLRTFCASLHGSCEGEASPRCIYWREVSQ